MTHTVQVVWVNADGPHGLLPDKHAVIELDVDGASLAPTASTRGRRDFVLPVGAQKVKLRATFSAEFGAVAKAKAPAMKEVVLEATQQYTVTNNGTALKPVAEPGFGGGPHPLVDTKSASGAAGATVIRIHTEFVDISKFWFAYASFAGDYQTDHVAGTKLVPLGFTGGAPKIWFASVADAATTSTRPEVSCLVFYRPANYAYSRIDMRHDMFGLNRYLLRPTADPAAPEYKREKFLKKSDGKPYVWIRAGFEHAMTQVAKPLVMLHPWPSGTGFGGAAGASLPTLCDAALRFLWARGNIGVGAAAQRLGRLGVAGYSAGGFSLFSAFQKTATRISELYLFDAQNASVNAPGVAAWFRAHKDPRLRMASGNSIATHVALKRTIEQAMGQPQQHVTVIPDSKTMYAKGANPIWDETTSAFPQHQLRSGFWHQFAIFGAVGQPPLLGTPNFMHQFLASSGF